MNRLITSALFALFLFVMIWIALSTPTVHRKPYMIVNGDTIHKPINIRQW